MTNKNGKLAFPDRLLKIWTGSNGKNKSHPCSIQLLCSSYIPSLDVARHSWVTINLDLRRRRRKTPINKAGERRKQEKVPTFPRLQVRVPMKLKSGGEKPTESHGRPQVLTWHGLRVQKERGKGLYSWDLGHSAVAGHISASWSGRSERKCWIRRSFAKN